MSTVEVFADITCPFSYVGLRRLMEERHRRARLDVRFVVRSWPLELVNGQPLLGATLAPKVDALRATVAADLFAGFDPSRFPTTSLPALALVAAAYDRSVEAGEELSLALRVALFERGADIGDRDTLTAIAASCGLDGLVGDEQAVQDDWEDGKARNVKGSPHFFLPSGDFFCPSLEISHADGTLQISFDQHGFHTFTDALFT